MDTREQLFQFVQDYMSERLDLQALDNWMSDHIEELASLPDGDPAGDLWDYTQMRIYQLQDGFLPEPDLRVAVARYLKDHPTPKERQRATG